MVTAIEIRNDDPGSEEPAWTAYGVSDGEWVYLQDATSIDELLKKIQPYIQEGDFTRITIVL